MSRRAGPQLGEISERKVRRPPDKTRKGPTTDPGLVAMALKMRAPLAQASGSRQAELAGESPTSAHRGTKPPAPNPGRPGDPLASPARTGGISGIPRKSSRWHEGIYDRLVGHPPMSRRPGAWPRRGGGNEKPRLAPGFGRERHRLAKALGPADDLGRAASARRRQAGALGCALGAGQAVLEGRLGHVPARP